MGLLFCGFLFLKETNFLFMNDNVLSQLVAQNSSLIYYKKHATQDLVKNINLSQHQAHNSDEVAPADTDPVVLNIQNVSSNNNPLQHQIYNSQNTATATTPVTQVTQSSKEQEINPATEDDQDIKYKHSRFVLSHSYWEQQTNALINMWSLQKWANKSGKLKVVEPFAVDSVLEFPASVLYKHQFTNALHFRDYFDLDYWTKETAKLGIEPLVTWETFLKYANRKVIVGLLAYGYAPGGVYVGDEINRCHSCKLAQDTFSHATNSLFTFLHFEVTKTVCFSYFGRQDTLSLEKFNSYLISDSDATIWFGLWRGIEKPGNSRIQIGDESLYRSVDHVLSMVHASPRIIDDSKNYVKTILNSDFREYTAINIRSARRYAEMVLKGRPSSAVMSYFTNCVGKLNDILDKSGSTSYFLGTDIGKFGDRTAFKLNDNDSAKLLQQLLQVLYGNKTIDVYQNEFIKAANGVEDRGYLATMQKTIAEHAKCLIIMGGFSTFQESVVINYKNDGQFNCVKYLCYEDPI